MSGENQRQDGLSFRENKSATLETIAEANSPVTSNSKVINFYVYRLKWRCGFVVAQGDRHPFCDRPALKGSSYCARHHALCTVAPDSDEAARLLREQDRISAESAPPPPELAQLAAADLPEPMDESDAERLAGIELARERAEITDN